MGKGKARGAAAGAAPYLREDGAGRVTIAVHVRPGARVDRIAGPDPWRGALAVDVAAPAERGKANARLVELIATRLQVRASDVEVVRGHTSRDKVLAVSGLEADEARRRLEGGA